MAFPYIYTSSPGGNVEGAPEAYSGCCRWAERWSMEKQALRALKLRNGAQWGSNACNTLSYGTQLCQVRCYGGLSLHASALLLGLFDSEGPTAFNDCCGVVGQI